MKIRFVGVFARYLKFAHFEIIKHVYLYDMIFPDFCSRNVIVHEENNFITNE
jgi:hypothetical protein